MEGDDIVQVDSLSLEDCVARLREKADELAHKHERDRLELLNLKDCSDNDAEYDPEGDDTDEDSDSSEGFASMDKVKNVKPASVETESEEDRIDDSLDDFQDSKRWPCTSAFKFSDLSFEQLISHMAYFLRTKCFPPALEDLLYNKRLEFRHKCRLYRLEGDTVYNRITFFSKKLCRKVGELSNILT